MILRIIFLGLCLLLQNSNSFLTYLNVPPRRRVQVYEADTIKKNESNCVIFFGGGSNSISHRVYDGFFTSLQRQNISVFVPCFNYQYIHFLVRYLKRKYKNIAMIGHSSGCNTLLNQCNHKYIEKVILIDPVKTSLFQEQKFHLHNVKSILIYNALKSYSITYNPFGLPFIPSFLRISFKNMVCLSNKYEINAIDYGHSDILNPEFSNVMHNTRITVGHPNRSSIHLENYHDLLSIFFAEFIQHEKIYYPTFLQ